MVSYRNRYLLSELDFCSFFCRTLHPLTDPIEELPGQRCSSCVARKDELGSGHVGMQDCKKDSLKFVKTIFFVMAQKDRTFLQTLRVRVARQLGQEPKTFCPPFQGDDESQAKALVTWLCVRVNQMPLFYLLMYEYVNDREPRAV